LNKKHEIFVSAISDNPKNIFVNLPIFEKTGISGIHLDVMDGSFVPRFGLYPELMREIIDQTKLEIEIHMMVKDPEPYINQLIKIGANRIILHLETLIHPHRTLSMIKESGVDSGVALNPGTNLECLEYIMDQVDMVLLMAINPGIPKHPFIPRTFHKLVQLKNMISENDLKCRIGIDGGVTIENAKSLVKNGADILICGSGTIFKENNDIESNIRSLNNLLK
jgi:ribulose-phosphate 3-epimerase